MDLRPVTVNEAPAAEAFCARRLSAIRRSGGEQPRPVSPLVSCNESDADIGDLMARRGRDCVSTATG